MSSYDESDEDFSADEPSDKKVQELSDLSNSSFLNTVRNAFSFLTEDDAPAYFKTVLEHFENPSLKNEYGKEILISIRKLIRRDEIFEVFKNKKVILKLPFKKKSYSDQVYAIIYDIANKDPSLLDKRFCDQNHFVYLVKEDPKKALSIIWNFARKVYDDSESNRSPIFEILVNQAIFFITPDLIESYISIICFLCKENEDFCTNYVEDIWKLLVKQISKSDIECHNSIYLGFCNLLESNNTEKKIDMNLPFEALDDDLNQKLTQETALKFIYYFAISDDKNTIKLNNPELFSTLISLASKDVKEASILLIFLADKNQELASTILQCQKGKWMLKPLPQASDTLRLFMTIFQYESLRNQISSNRNFVPFLNYCLKSMASPGIVTIITTIVRRVKLTDDIVSKFVEKEFIQQYIKTALDSEDETKVSSHALLLMINTLTKFDCADQFLDVIPTIKKLLDDENLSEIASFAAADLSSNEKCMNKMLDLEIGKFFKKHLKDQSKSLRHNSRRFLRNKKKMLE